MVAAISTTSRIPKTPSTRPPLSPSEKSNTTNNNNADSVSRKPRSKEITSRYIHSSSASSSTSSLPNRSQIANRARPRTPTAESPRPLSSTTTRSLSVSFQGASFSFQTTKPKPISQNPTKKPRNAASALAAKTRHANSPTKSLDCSLEKKGPILAAVRVLGHSVVFDDKVKRASFDGDDFYLASDSDSSNSGSKEGNTSAKGRAVVRGISIPEMFWPESFSPAKKSGSLDALQLVSPRMGSLIRPCSPGKVMASSVKGMASPLKVQPCNAPSILSFAAEARRVKKSESRIEEAHSFRLLYNRYLQWRCVNAQAEAALLVQNVNVEKNLYNAWLTTSELCDSVTNKRIKLQLLLQNLKLASILKGQMTYVEQWSLMDREHYNYLSGLIEALKASTLRLPVVSGARVDIHKLQNAVGSAVDVMQAMGTSVCSLLSKVERPSALMSELAKAAAHERALLDQSKDLLSTVAAMHVKQFSLQGHILQLNRSTSLVQL